MRRAPFGRSLSVVVLGVTNLLFGYRLNLEKITGEVEGFSDRSEVRYRLRIV